MINHLIKDDPHMIATCDKLIDKGQLIMICSPVSMVMMKVLISQENYQKCTHEKIIQEIK